MDRTKEENEEKLFSLVDKYQGEKLWKQSLMSLAIVLTVIFDGDRIENLALQGPKGTFAERVDQHMDSYEQFMEEIKLKDWEKTE